MTLGRQIEFCRLAVISPKEKNKVDRRLPSSTKMMILNNSNPGKDKWTKMDKWEWFVVMRFLLLGIDGVKDRHNFTAFPRLPKSSPKNPGCERNPFSKGAWESRDSMSVRVLKFPSSRKCAGIPPQDRRKKQTQVRAHNSTCRVCFTAVTPLEGNVFRVFKQDLNSSQFWMIKIPYSKDVFGENLIFHGLWTSRKKENLNFGNIKSFRKCSW